METPPKEVSTSQYISGVRFALSWMFLTGFFGYGLFFVSVMAAGIRNADETIGKLLVLFISLGAGMITFAGCAGGAATASVVQSEKDKKWKTFRWMISCGLGLLAIGFILFTRLLN
jgi:hypothetical protein